MKCVLEPLTSRFAGPDRTPLSLKISSAPVFKFLCTVVGCYLVPLHSCLNKSLTGFRFLLRMPYISVYMCCLLQNLYRYSLCVEGSEYSRREEVAPALPRVFVLHHGPLTVLALKFRAFKTAPRFIATSIVLKPYNSQMAASSRANRCQHVLDAKCFSISSLPPGDPRNSSSHGASRSEHSSSSESALDFEIQREGCPLWSQKDSRGLNLPAGTRRAGLSLVLGGLSTAQLGLRVVRFGNLVHGARFPRIIFPLSSLQSLFFVANVPSKTPPASSSFALCRSICLSEDGISLPTILNLPRHPPRRSRRKKHARHRGHVSLLSLWFSAWRCRCSDLIYDFPHPANLQSNFLILESCDLELE